MHVHEAESGLTVIEHLDELRKRLLIVFAAVGIATLVSVPLASFFLRILKEPAAAYVGRLVFFGPEEAFLVYMRVSFLAGIIIAFPVIAYQIWAFVAPAVTTAFRRHCVSFVFFFSAAFIGGCLFAYYLLLPSALAFLLSLGKGDLEPLISAERYISFVTGFIFAAGLVFEMPVASFILSKAGVLTPQWLRRRFKFALIGICILAAVITPTGDIFNMTILAVPMIFLYEISIWVSKLACQGRGYGKETSVLR